MTAALPSIAQAAPSLKPYQPFGFALELMYAKEDEVVVHGAAGTGKTRAWLEKLHLVCCKYPGARCLLVRKTRESLTQSAMVTFETKVIPDNGLVTWRTTEQEYRYWNGSRIVVGGLDKSSRIMSTEYDIIFVPEVTELTEGEWEDLTTRARNGVVPYNQTVADCNPSTSLHWVKRRMDAGKAKGIFSRHEDNPTLFDHGTGDWTERGKAYLTKLSNLSGVRRQRLFLGLWVTAEGLVYDEFDPEIHLINRSDIPKEWRKFRVVDFGFTNPFVCQWYAVNPDNRLILYRELYHTRRTVREHAKFIKELSQGEDIETTVCDWDAEDRATLEENGIDTEPADKSISVGIDSVKELLKDQGDGKPGIYFMRDALVERDLELEEAVKPLSTTEEIIDFVWSDSARKERPIAVNDHGMDCLRYAARYHSSYSANGGIFT